MLLDSRIVNTNMLVVSEHLMNVVTAQFMVKSTN